MLGDKDARVSAAAAGWLLPAETRSSLGFSYQYFLFDRIHAGASSDDYGSGDDRPLAPITPAPDFLKEVRDRAAAADLDSLAVFSVVLAQYGDNSALDRLLPKLPEGEAGEQYRSTVLAAIALARDPRYLAQVRRFMTAAMEEWALQSILQSIRGVTGPEARALRLEINRRLRAGKGEES